MTEFVVAAFYHFSDLPDFPDYQASLASLCDEGEVTGTILLAHEGVNGTIAGPRAGVDKVLAALRQLPGCAGLEHKESFAPENPFYRAKVRLKKEIVTLGVPGVNPNKAVGEYVEPEDWNDLIAQQDIVLIDTRNDYEVGIGTFEGAINPQTESFREFPDWFRKFNAENPNARYAMFCTGGIRCEKSTAFLKQEGVEEVYHLKGGILKYLERISEENSAWNGECFVFDNRVSVGHDLAPGTYDMCHACRRPLSDGDKVSEAYVKGVSCPHCIEEHGEERREAFAERERQINLAKARGERHIGVRRHVKKGGAQRAQAMADDASDGLSDALDNSTSTE